MGTFALSTTSAAKSSSMQLRSGQLGQLCRQTFGSSACTPAKTTVASAQSFSDFDEYPPLPGRRLMRSSLQERLRG